jgi:hypothetical protein
MSGPSRTRRGKRADRPVDDPVAADGHVAVEHDERVGAERGTLLDDVHCVEHRVLHRRLRRRQLRRPLDRLEEVGFREPPDLRRVGGDDDAAQQLGLPRVCKGVLDDRPPEQREEVLVLQPRAARAGEDYAKNVHAYDSNEFLELRRVPLAREALDLRSRLQRCRVSFDVLAFRGIGASPMRLPLQRLHVMMHGRDAHGTIELTHHRCKSIWAPVIRGLHPARCSPTGPKRRNMLNQPSACRYSHILKNIGIAGFGRGLSH